MRNRKWAAALLCLFLCGCSAKPSTDEIGIPDQMPQKQETVYQEETVSFGTFEKTIATAGNLYFLNSEAVTMEEDGAVLAEEIQVKRGATVKAGDILAKYTFDSDPTDLKTARLEYEQAQKSYENELSQHDSKLAAKQAEIETLSGEDRKIAELELETLQLEKQTYQANQQQKIDQLKEQVDELTKYSQPLLVRAPVDGVIASVPENTVVGTETPKGTPLFTLYSTDKVLVRCMDMEYQKFLYGMPVEIYATAAGVDFKSSGHVAASPHGIMEGSGEGGLQECIYVSIDDQAALNSLLTYCRDNQKSFTDLTLAVRGVSVRIQNTALVSTSAIHFDTNAEDSSVTTRTGWVYLKGEDGSISRRNILAGPSNNSQTCVFDGLDEGDCVVLNY